MNSAITKISRLILTGILVMSLGLTSYAITTVIGSPATQNVSGTVTVTALPTGSNTIGAVNIAAAQTLATVTTVGAVTAITNALPAGTNIIGALSANQSVNVAQVNGVATTMGAGASGTGTQRVILASDSPGGTVILTAETTKVIGTVNVAAAQTIAVTNAGTFAVQSSAVVATPVNTKVGATGTSAQLIAANATRKGLTIKTDCANTADVAINYGAGVAVYASHDILPPCASWEPPAGVVVQTAIQVISASGTQQVRVVEYQ